MNMPALKIMAINAHRYLASVGRAARGWHDRAIPLLAPALISGRCSRSAMSQDDCNGDQGLNEDGRPGWHLDVAAGLVSGVVQAGAFNPWDRALYLSVKNHTAFLNRSNWSAPYHGFSQAVVGRAVQGGLYFLLQSTMSRTLGAHLEGRLEEPAVSFLVGMAAGSANGVVLAPLSAVKYYSWGMEGSRFLAVSARMYRQGGVRPFFKAVAATAARDMVFGCVYEVSRHALRRHVLSGDGSDNGRTLAANTAAAAMATALSGPMNYVRNIKLSTLPQHSAPSTFSVLADLVRQARSQPRLSAACAYVQQRLRIGWGTGRVAVGVGFGQLLFDWARSALYALEPR